MKDDVNKKLSPEDWAKLSKEEKDKIIQARKLANQNKKNGKKGGRDGGGKKDGDGIPWKNDWKFYAINEQLAKDFASFPYNVLGGIGWKQKFLSMSGNAVSTAEVEVHEQSVLVVDYINSVGTAKTKTDAINIAALMLYTLIRTKNSGATNYEPADVMMYILGMRDIYSEYIEDKRILGIARLYDISNHNLPDLLLSALRIDSDDLRENIATYRGRLNLLCEKINAFAVPSYFKAFDRAAYISSKIFADSDSIRGQFYLFRRSYRYMFSATSSETGGMLKATATSTNVAQPITFGQRLDQLEAMVNAMFLDTDIMTMSGDILKAFKEEGDRYSVVPTPDDYVVMPVMDEDILAQIENSYCVYNGSMTIPNVIPFDVTQSNGLIMFNPTATSAGTSTPNFGVANHIFNSHKDSPDYTDNLEWSRLINTSHVNGTSIEVKSGLELLTGYRMWKQTVGTGTPNNTQIYSCYGYSESQTVVPSIVLQVMDLGQYDWHPIIYFYQDNSPVRVFADLKKFTVLEQSTVENTHLSAVTAAFWAVEKYKASQA